MRYEDIIDIPSAKERFMGNYKIFSKFLYQFPERSLFSDLKEQINQKEIEKAFETAHTMKGIVGNLSLKEIEKPLLPLVEVLRKGENPTDQEWEALEEAYKHTVEEIRNIQKEDTPLF